MLARVALARKPIWIRMEVSGLWYGLKVASGSSSDSDGMGKSGWPGLGGEGLGKDWAPAKNFEWEKKLVGLGFDHQVVKDGQR